MVGGLEVVDQLVGRHRRPVGLRLRVDARCSSSRTTAGSRPRSRQASARRARAAAAVVEAESTRGPVPSRARPGTISASVVAAMSSGLGFLLFSSAEASTPRAVTITTPHPIAIWRMPRTTGRGTGPAGGQALEGDDHEDGGRAGQRRCGRQRPRRGRRGRRRPASPAVADPGLRRPVVEAGDLGPHVGDRRDRPARRAPARPRRRAGRRPRPASTTIAATEHTPTAPASSGTRRRPRERTSNQPSTRDQRERRRGPATQNARLGPAARPRRPARRAPRARPRRPVAPGAVRSRARPRRRSTATIFSGVRARNATIAAERDAHPADARGDQEPEHARSPA